MTSLPKKQILLQNWPLICHKIPMNQSIHIVIIHFEGYYSQVLAFGQEVADFLIMELHERLRRRVSQDQAFVVVDLHWNNDKAVVLDSLDVCLIYSGSEWLNRASVFDDFYQTIAQPIMCREVSLDIDLSIGLSLLDRDESVQNAIRRAQVASKEASQRRLHILEYDNKLGHDPEYTTALMTQFQNDLRHKRLVLVFQPQINTTNGELHGVEALIRWQHPEQGWLSPDFFIPLVEQSGLIHELAEYVLIESCRFYQNILAIFQRSLSISINLSARNFTDKNLTRFVSTVLSEYDVPAKKITFELTETAILGDLSTSKLVFQQLLDVGVNIALDDFGVGYSSLVYLKELPFSELKIDKGFLLQDSHTHQGSSLIKAAIELGKALDMLVVAEGVETLALAQMLNQLGCEICQGYFYAKPLSTDEFIEWLQNFDHKRNIIEPDYVAKPSLN